MFELRETGIAGCLELGPKRRDDERGRFVKTIHADFFAQHGMTWSFAEQYYSLSRRGVLRGLHFQSPPSDHDKLVYCPSGEVFDAVVDLRRSSPTYGEHRTLTLSAEKANQLYIPAGLAHGFVTLSDAATMIYNVSSVHDPAHDQGVHYASAGINWPEADPIVSARDAGLPELADFDSPFG